MISALSYYFKDKNYAEIDIVSANGTFKDNFKTLSNLNNISEFISITDVYKSILDIDQSGVKEIKKYIEDEALLQDINNYKIVGYYEKIRVKSIIKSYDIKEVNIIDKGRNRKDILVTFSCMVASNKDSNLLEDDLKLYLSIYYDDGKIVKHEILQKPTIDVDDRSPIDKLFEMIE